MPPHRVLGFQLLLFFVALMLGSLMSVATAQANSGDCPPTCGPPVPAYVLASNEEDHNAARAERWRRDQRRRDRSDAERRARKNVRSLERRLDRAEARERKARYGRRHGKGSNDGQAGSHCMYGADGRLIYAPRGETCVSREGGAIAGPASLAPAVAQGCASGNCQNGKGTYVWSDGTRYVGGFKGGLQHGQGSVSQEMFIINEKHISGIKKCSSMYF